MLNKKAKTLNENNSQLELAIQKEIDMTNKTEKEVVDYIKEKEEKKVLCIYILRYGI